MTQENLATQRHSVFVVPTLTSAPDEVYEASLRAAERAEALGFDGFWIAEGHVSSIATPSALAFLAAASQRTSRVRLGTAVIPLALTDRLHIAEVAAFVDWISGHRLELGLGKGNPGGFSAAGYSARGLDEDQRDALFASSLDDLRSLLRGAEGAPSLVPPAIDIDGRLWQATSSVRTAAAAGSAGDGLQLHRLVPGAHGVVDLGARQRPLIDAYLAALAPGRAPRIAVSRVVLVAENRAAAINAVRDDLASRPERHPFRREGVDAEQYLIESGAHFGAAADVAASLARDAAARGATELLFASVLDADHPAFLESLERIAAELRPLVRAEAPAVPV